MGKENCNSFTDFFFDNYFKDLNQFIFKTEWLLSERFNKCIKVDRLPLFLTEEDLSFLLRYNLGPVFLPDEKIYEDRQLKNWVTPPSWFYQKIKERKIVEDFADFEDRDRLKRGWYFADFTVSADYTDGSQVWRNDPFSPIIKELRENNKIGKDNNTPLGSRFSISPRNEWSLVFSELANEIERGIGIKPRITFEPYIVFNAIGNLYDKNRGNFNSWEWFADPLRCSHHGRLFGGRHDNGGLANVFFCYGDDRFGDIAARPLVSFE